MATKSERVRGNRTARRTRETLGLSCRTVMRADVLFVAKCINDARAALDVHSAVSSQLDYIAVQ